MTRKSLWQFIPITTKTAKKQFGRMSQQGKKITINGMQNITLKIVVARTVESAQTTSFFSGRLKNAKINLMLLIKLETINMYVLRPIRLIAILQVITLSVKPIESTFASQHRKLRSS